jgi:alpha-beta hydrolase superfamily lysophospholipase
VRSSLLACLGLAVFMASAVPTVAATSEKLEIRGQAVGLTVYPARGTVRGTIIMGSGDVGWVGLAASLADEYSAEGYIVLGLNVRQYLSTFTTAKTHLQASDVPGDYRAILAFARENRLVTRPVIVSGVSEGAALAVLAASDARNHDWIDGVITMGLPPTAELAWRWSDSLSWVTKRDAPEPSFSPHDVIASVSPVPLYMIQSTKDEYVTAADYERFRATAKAPRQLVLIDASNHRFTDRRKELSAAFTQGLAWIAQLASKPR